MVGDAEGVGDVGDMPGDVGNLRGVTDIMFQIVCVEKGSKKILTCIRLGGFRLRNTTPVNCDTSHCNC